MRQHIYNAIDTRRLYIEDALILLNEEQVAVPHKISPVDIEGAWSLKPKSSRLLNKMDLSIYPEGLLEEYIPNPRFPANAVATRWNIVKNVGRTLTGMGMVIDGVSLHSEWQKSRRDGDYQNTYQEGARIVGSLSAAYAGGMTGARLGAMGCAPMGPYTSAGCVIIGGLAGSIAGYHEGGKQATEIFNKSQQQFRTTIWNELIAQMPKAFVEPQKEFSSHTSLLKLTQEGISVTPKLGAIDVSRFSELNTRSTQSNLKTTSLLEARTLSSRFFSSHSLKSSNPIPIDTTLILPLTHKGLIASSGVSNFSFERSAKIFFPGLTTFSSTSSTATSAYQPFPDAGDIARKAWQKRF